MQVSIRVRGSLFSDGHAVIGVVPIVLAELADLEFPDVQSSGPAAASEKPIARVEVNSEWLCFAWVCGFDRVILGSSGVSDVALRSIRVRWVNWPGPG